MCPKKLEIDNRDKKTPLVHRFMTPKAQPEPPPPDEENISPAESNKPSAAGDSSPQEIKKIDVETPAEIIPVEPPEDNPPSMQNVSSAEGMDAGDLIVTEVTAAPSTDDVPPSADVEAVTVKDDSAPDWRSEQSEETVNIAVNTDDKSAETISPQEEAAEEKSAEVDYKKFITTVQDKIDGITNNHLQAQEDMKAQLKAELLEEIKNELREEIAAKEKAAEIKPVSEPIKESPPPIVEKVGEVRYTFRNTMEDIVAEEVMGILKNEKNMCKCSRCVNDICAIALNAVPPHYVTSEVGQLYDRAGLLDITKLSDLTKNIFKAVDQVKNSPSHLV